MTKHKLHYFNCATFVFCHQYQGLVSLKPKKLFRPAKPYLLVNWYVKTKRWIHLKLLVWREPLIVLLRFSITCGLWNSKLNRQMCFLQPLIKHSVAPLSFDYYRELFRCLNCAWRFYYCVLGSSWKLGGATKHLIDGSKSQFCWLSFEF